MSAEPINPLWVDPKPAALKAAGALRARLGEAAGDPVVFRGEVTVVVKAERILDACRFLKLDPEHSFEMLTDLTGIHFVDKDWEFEVVYLLYSFRNNCRLRLIVRLAETNRCPSVTSVWGTADWHEREAFDLVGVVFEGHPNLKRILMPDDYEFHPLRKDFPLEGHGA